MNFSKSILSDKPYLGAEVGGIGVCVFLSVEAVVVAEVAEVREVEKTTFRR